jgi:HprK-related kinase A
MTAPTLASLQPAELNRRLRSRRADSGLALRTGPYTIRLRSSLPEIAQALPVLYGNHPLADATGFIDFDVGVRRPWWRRGRHAQVRFDFEGQEPFNPLPGPQAVPMLEWGLNWCVSALCHQTLNLHAAVLERHGRALLLPAPSGSGKSTLCAALAFGGWRLLSDELAMIDPATGGLVPLPRPISLKNASIETLRRHAPEAVVGSQVADTLKGRVAHLRPPADAVARGGEQARPGWIVLPRYRAGASTSLKPLEPARAFMQLVENAFNYDVFGAPGFELLAQVVDHSRCLSFEYGGDLVDAVACFERLASESVR